MLYNLDTEERQSTKYQHDGATNIRSFVSFYITCHKVLTKLHYSLACYRKSQYAKDQSEQNLIRHFNNNYVLRKVHKCKPMNVNNCKTVEHYNEIFA